MYMQRWIIMFSFSYLVEANFLYLHFSIYWAWYVLFCSLVCCRYGGVYLDSDIIMLQPLPSFNNTVGLEDELNKDSLNGAVMAFKKHRLMHPFPVHLLIFLLFFCDQINGWISPSFINKLLRWFCFNKIEHKLYGNFWRKVFHYSVIICWYWNAIELISLCICKLLKELNSSI